MSFKKKVGLLLFIGLGLFVFKLSNVNQNQHLSYYTLHTPNKSFIKEVEKKVIVQINPEENYSYAVMEAGVIQHLDRTYTYDYIPEILNGGILYQGMHRPVKGTIVSIELFEPADIFFFFHHTVDGGYTEIFKNEIDWQECFDNPKYDVYNGDHGKYMKMFKLSSEAGKFEIPATTKDRACFSIVFKFIIL